MSNIRWADLLVEARNIVTESTYPLTLRGLHYQLVSAGAYPNTTNSYKALSRHTATGRRAGTFPALAEDGRSFNGWRGDSSPQSALNGLVQRYCRDRTEGQEFSVVLAVEKRTLLPVLDQAFRELGIPIVALGGYPSQTLCDRVISRVEQRGRPAVLLIATDFDGSGEDIARDFGARTRWSHSERVALDAEQVADLSLPQNPGKASDSRARAFAARHGSNVQVELEALTPEQLVAFYSAALEPWWSDGAYDAVRARETAERELLAAVTL